MRVLCFNTGGLLFICLVLPGLIQLPDGLSSSSKQFAAEALSCPPNGTFYGTHCECSADNQGYNCHHAVEDTTVVICSNLDGLLTINEGNVTENVTCLVIIDSSVPYLNKSMMEHFPKIRGLHLPGAGLSRIANDAFEANTLLQFLVLENNFLTVLPPLRGLRNLFELDISDNMIASMTKADFTDVTKLRKLLARSNRVTSLTDGVFAKKCDLAEIDLNLNRELAVVESNVFEETPVSILHLGATKITEVPVTDSLRSWMTRLFLEETYELKEFNAFLPGPKYYNQTFPRLREVRFAYHSHCCQLKIANNGRPHRSYGLPSLLPGKRAASILMRIGARLFGKTRVTRDSPTIPAYTCVNVTTEECINDLSSVNVSDSSVVRILNADSLCNSSLNLTLPCLQGICNGGCDNCTNNSNIAMSNYSVVCVPAVQPVSITQSLDPTSAQPTPTPSLSFSMASLATSSGVMTLPTPSSTLATTDIAVLPTPTSTPSCLNGSSLFSSHIIRDDCTVQATTPTPTPTPSPVTEPPPPEPCDADYCSRTSTSFNDELICDQCKDRDCELGFGTCDEFMSIPGFCSCNFGRKRRSFFNSNEADIVRKMLPNNRLKRNVNCMIEVSVVCVNCSSGEVPPDGWFYLNSTSQVICTEQNNTTTEPTPTTSQTDATTATTVTTNDLITDGQTGVECRTVDLSSYVENEETVCLPVPNGFNPCTDLLNDDHYLRVAIWFVIILAFVGNALVIFVFIFYTCIIRRAKMDHYVMHFFYFNLALADFLMCLYLLTIASEDLYTLDEFYIHDISWRTGSGCGFAGFTAILSTVVSVYVLTVITLERAYTIINAMHRRSVSKQVAAVLMGLGWALGFLLAVLPITGNVSSYNAVAICLPFRVDSDLDKSYVVFLLLATGLAFLVIAVTYIVIFGHIFCRKSLAYTTNSRRATEIKVAIRMFVLVFTNFVCWFPIALVSLAAVFGDGIVQDIEFAKWAIVFIFPINACLNPILYSLSTRVFRENFIIVLGKMRLCTGAANKIVRRRANVTPSALSQNSQNKPTGRRPTLIERLRLLSISSQGSSSDLSQRRGSNLSSDHEHYKISLLNKRRRSSIMSDSSNEDMLYNRNVIRRGSSGTSIDETSVSISNPNFRSNSPVGVYPTPTETSKTSRPKISVSSLGTLPEEGELVAPTIDQNVIKVNPAYCEEEEDQVDFEQTPVDTDSGQYSSEQTTDIVGRNGVIVTDGDVTNCPQHQIVASDQNEFTDENDSGHSENFSGSPSIDEFNEDHQIESVVKEIDFD